MTQRWRAAVRWLAVAVAVLLGHILVLGVLGRLPSSTQMKEALRILEVRLLAPEPVLPPLTPDLHPQSRLHSPRPSGSAAKPEPSRPVIPNQTAQPPAIDSASSNTHGETLNPQPSGNALPSNEQASVTAAGAPDSEAQFALPPSIEVRYDTYVNGIRNQGGTLSWHTDGHTYAMEVATSVPFLGRFAFQSRGHVDAYGLAPDHYTEVRGRRPPASATFHRGDTPTIKFSRHAQDQPFAPGAQDRFSVFMQMVGLLRGAAHRYETPGTTLSFTVVDTRGAESIQVQYVGEESVNTGGENVVHARHFVRLPRHPGDDRVVEVWLAESLGWMPARLRQTEPNGLQFELIWKGQAGS